MKMPCEVIIWYILPLIRKEIAKCMVEDYHLSQADASRKLGITQATVSQYVSKKRARQDIRDDAILTQIKKSTKRIIEGDESVLFKETCKICSLIKKSDILPSVYKNAVKCGTSKGTCV